MTEATQPLIDRIRRTPVPDPALAADMIGRIREAAGSTDRLRAAVADDDGAALKLLVGVFTNAPFLRDIGLADPVRLERVLFSAPEETQARLLVACAEPRESEAALMTALRRMKTEASLAIALADLSGAWRVDDVTTALTFLADAALSAAIRFLIREGVNRGDISVPDPEQPEPGCGYVVLAMGKHGAYELNYSSDIDLIVIYDRAVAKLKDPDAASSYFVKITRRLVRIMQERTADGYVFRTDLRLRPDPGATPIAISMDAALVYYESLGQNWERAALIKARPAAGDIAVGNDFLKEIVPFIWRKSFDYASIADVHSIKRQINAVKGFGNIAVAGHNVKLGRGGIREIEFFVQTQQLIAGGRDPDLRGKATLDMLAALQRKGWIDDTARDELGEAYRFLRMVEHRIQMVLDEQTHSLPNDPAGVARIARLAGFADPEAFGTALRTRLERVQTHYMRLFENAPTLSSASGNLVFSGDDDDPETLETLSRMGYAKPADIARIVRSWHYGRYPVMRSAKARERLTEIVPLILEAFARTENADQAILAFDKLLSQLPVGLQLFAILKNNPGVLNFISVILGAAPRMADIITRRPRVVDALLEPAFFGQVPTTAELDRRLRQYLREARRYEEVLDRARIFGQEQAVLIGVRVLTGTLSPADAGAAFAGLADILVRALLAGAQSELMERHGSVPGGAIAVVAMGKLGGREMTAASDLDLILLYDHDPEAMGSDGAKSLAPTVYYTRLTQRLVAALSAPTAEGTLYEVDFRLRPSGQAGPLATRVSAFETYQDKDAWTWEHMALTRARLIAGDPALIARAKASIRKVLTRPRDPAKLALEVADMRARIQAEKGSKDVWDLKQVAGGLVDLEFIAQFLQLRHAAEAPDILHTTTATVLRAAARKGFLPLRDAEILLPAADLYHELTQVMRLAVEGPFNPLEAPRGVQRLIAEAAGLPEVGLVAEHLRTLQAEVRAAFERVVGPVKRTE